MALLRSVAKKNRLPFNRLQQLQTLTGDNRVGGDFALPVEFDSRKFASAFVARGNEVTAAQNQQLLTGTQYVADGWKVWKYPAEIPTGKLDEHNKPVFKPHRLAGKPHKVTSRIKGGGTFVLMYRDAEVQNEVNQVYANLSRDNLEAEVTGQTVAGASVQDDRGMLGADRLPQHEHEPYEPPTAIEAPSLPTDGIITKRSKTLRQ